MSGQRVTVAVLFIEEDATVFGAFRPGRR